jgi:hypothetical protein
MGQYGFERSVYLLTMKYFRCKIRMLIQDRGVLKLVR